AFLWADLGLSLLVLALPLLRLPRRSGWPLGSRPVVRARGLASLAACALLLWSPAARVTSVWGFVASTPALALASGRPPGRHMPLLDSRSAERGDAAAVDV